jgi:Spy/CpxP family protein refolding chaperone
MKNSLKLLICVLTLGVMSTPALRAQDEKAPPAEGGKKGGKGGGRGMQMSPEQQIARLEEAVGTLTADQKTKITAVYEKAAKDMQAVPQEERRAKMPEMMQATRKEVRALLTDEQAKKFDDMPMPGRGGPGGKKKGGGN